MFVIILVEITRGVRLLPQNVVALWAAPIFFVNIRLNQIPLSRLMTILVPICDSTMVVCSD
jgi:hypothetical protein